MNNQDDKTIQTENVKSLTLTTRINQDKTCESRMDVYGSPEESEKVAMLQSMAFGIISDLTIFMDVPGMSRMLTDMMIKALEKTSPEQAAALRSVRTAAQKDAAHSVAQFNKNHTKRGW